MYVHHHFIQTESSTKQILNYGGGITKRMNFNAPVVESSESIEPNDNDLELMRSVTHFLTSSSPKSSKQTFIVPYLPTYLPAYLPPYLPTYLSTYLPTYLPTYLFLPPFLPTYLPTYLPSYLPTYLGDSELGRNPFLHQFSLQRRTGKLNEKY